MNYYRLTIKKYPDYEALITGPTEMAELMQQDPQVESIKQISRSTFYRIRRRDAQAFWQGIEDSMAVDQ